MHSAFRRLASLSLLSALALGASGCPRDHDEQWHREHPDEQWRREHPDDHDAQWHRDHDHPDEHR